MWWGLEEVAASTMSYGIFMIGIGMVVNLHDLEAPARSRIWVKLYLSPQDYNQCNGPVVFEQYYSTTCEGKESIGPARWCLGDSHRPTLRTQRSNSTWTPRDAH